MGRDRFLPVIEGLLRSVYSDIINGVGPRLRVPKRTFSSVEYDKKRGYLVLKGDMLERRMLDLGEARRFMQTVLVLSVIKQAIEEGDYPTIRDIYYSVKHTITWKDPMGRTHQENTFEEQRESDTVIEDIEVMLGILREELGIMFDAKGRAVGKIKIRSKGHTIELDKMGVGAWAIPPNVDEVEILDVDAEYVLIVEKGAIFERLNNEGFWKKHRCILVTGKGQPDRGTRRFVRRLADEFNLPVFILTDSIPADEVVVVKDLRTGRVVVGPVEEIIGQYFSQRVDREWADAPIAVPSMNPVTGKIMWTPVGYVYRHRIKDKILRLKVKGRGVVRVTRGHSLFVYRNGRIMVEPAYIIKPGDRIVVAERLPPLSDASEYQTINVASLLKENKRLRGKQFRIEDTLYLGLEDGSEISLGEASDEDIERALYVRLRRSKNRIPNKLVVDEELAWLFGLYTAEGSRSKDRYLLFNLGRHETDKAEKITNIIIKRFGIAPSVNINKGITVRVASKLLYLLFEALELLGTARTKRIPEIIINSPPSVLLSYLKGLFDGDGHVDSYGDIIYNTRSQILSKQVFIVLQSLGVNPTLLLNGDDYVIKIGRSSKRTPRQIYSALTGLESSDGLRGEVTYGIPIDIELKRELIRLTNLGVSSYTVRHSTISKAKISRLYEMGVLSIPSGLKPIVEGDIILAEVISVEEEDYDGYVYDFAVPGTNSFIGGYGVVYHNSDPYGFHIYSVYKYGSIKLAYESARLAIPDAKFLGVWVSDIYRYRIPRRYIIKATDADIKRAKELLRYPWFASDRRWRRELELFLKRREKVEIEAFSGFGFKFLSEKYIPQKLREQGLKIR